MRDIDRQREVAHHDDLAAVAEAILDGGETSHRHHAMGLHVGVAIKCCLEPI
ncbi:hypothetical protein [Roseateles koreensis]|uniref:Uncharacterized protein n=1 Tax=Roseateles koreensis TaxID=2987526 RepID=A0ABT5KN95_9BURK|nr:hypothetical protein [Roseateles koreensis]MDC8784394.1 hypothetical protein [Roseateles koreensis]